MANQTRKIIHIDMDAFYASVEQRDNLKYRGKPLAVGASPRQRGVVAAASYEARKFGIHSAMPSKQAIALCPNLIFVKPRFEVYRAISAQIHDVFRRYTDIVEPVALDEAYLDVTENKLGLLYASTVARHIRDEIFKKTNLTASAGVSVNKFLAKIASGMNKPNGMTVILPEEAEAFVESLPIEKFHGIGKVTAAKMRRLGIDNGLDLKERSREFLVRSFGKVGNYYYNIARAKDNRVVEANRIRKSIGAENSFAENLKDKETIIIKLEQIAQTLKKRIDRHQASGRTLTLKVKFSDYQQITRSRTFEKCINSLDVIITEAVELLEIVELDGKNIRLLGISLSNLNNSKKAKIIQLSLFE
ncbi:DNA polymerase IV [Myxosarcina sp. GI1]|uniref:DNA polymerase IV n=1 Tax=Myxosarcina sp. GI1 TaxID=1541065 RepID=UPI000567A911|nr:DNA polymerase IV [Myxosarcina sp. GI1]